MVGIGVGTVDRGPYLVFFFPPVSRTTQTGAALAADDPEAEAAEEEEQDAPCGPEGVGDEDAPGIVVEGALAGAEKGGVAVGWGGGRSGEGEEEGEGQGGAGEEEGDGGEVLGVPVEGLCEAVACGAVLAEPGLEAEVEEEAEVGVGGEGDKGVGGGGEVEGQDGGAAWAGVSRALGRTGALTDSPAPDERVGKLVEQEDTDDPGEPAGDVRGGGQLPVPARARAGVFGDPGQG